MAKISETSRYKNGVATVINGRNYIMTRKLLNLPLSADDFYILLDEGNQFRPDIISKQVYDDPNYGWAIMEVNGITNFLELAAGTRLRIPPLDLVLSAIPESNEQNT
jgi:hypothetical protein